MDQSCTYDYLSFIHSNYWSSCTISYIIGDICGKRIFFLPCVMNVPTEVIKSRVKALTVTDGEKFHVQSFQHNITTRQTDGWMDRHKHHINIMYRTPLIIIIVIEFL